MWNLSVSAKEPNRRPASSNAVPTTRNLSSVTLRMVFNSNLTQSLTSASSADVKDGGPRYSLRHKSPRHKSGAVATRTLGVARGYCLGSRPQMCFQRFPYAAKMTSSPGLALNAFLTFPVGSHLLSATTPCRSISSVENSSGEQSVQLLNRGSTISRDGRSFSLNQAVPCKVVFESTRVEYPCGGFVYETETVLLDTGFPVFAFITRTAIDSTL